MVSSTTPLIRLALCTALATSPLAPQDLPSSRARGRPAAARHPHGLAKRAPWTTSRVIGTPEPPPPYIAERVFPRLEFKNPVVITSHPPGDRLLVAELGGRIQTFPDDPQVGRYDLFIDLKRCHPRLSALYGVAFHPQFPRNRYVYICYVSGHGVPDGSRVSRFRVLEGEPPRCDPASETVILTWRSGGHNGGCLKFGPRGYLYISTGDGTGPFPPDGLGAGQNVGNLLASILRIDVDGADRNRAYRIPPDNPFVSMEAVRPEIWAYGFRNPWKMSFDPSTGDLLAGDVGWDLWEMIYRVVRGGNYGWSITEGRQAVHPERKRGPTPILPPLVDHPHFEARSITGGRVYTGERFAGLRGAYIYGDYETGKVWGLRHEKDRVTWHEELADTSLRIVAFGKDRAGELYLLEHIAGTIHRLVPRPATASRPEFPRRLSRTGLFEHVASQKPAAGVLPYSTRVESWADGARAQRYLALPGTSRIRRGASRWQFPPGTVIVKTLSLEMEQGTAESRRRLETQILHLDGDRWNGYAYEWNEEQSDAYLVSTEGMEREYTVIDPEAPGKKRRETWRFSSRAECLLCHNVWAGSVLGIEDRQMNRDHDYGGVVDNQLRALEHIGVFEGELGKPVDELPRFPYLHDESASPDSRARAYLHVNCAHCHRRNGGGSEVELLYERPLEGTQTLRVSPVLGSFGITDSRIVSPGDPYRSVLLFRMAALGSMRMPRIGSSVVDVAGVGLIHDWIEQLPGTPAGNEKGPPERGATATSVPGERAARHDAVARLCSATEPAAGAREAITHLLSSTSGALMLLRAIDVGRAPRAVLAMLREQVKVHPDPHVRVLFCRFLPENLRRKRLEGTIEPARILALEGDAGRGERLFLRGAARCRECHTLRGIGGDFGPDLTGLGAKSGKREVLESILEPSKVIDPKYTPYVLQATRGRVVSGLLMERNGREVVLKVGHEKLTRLLASEVLAVKVQKTSLMPEFLLADLTAQEVADLLEFLVSSE